MRIRDEDKRGSGERMGKRRDEAIARRERIRREERKE